MGLRWDLINQGVAEFQLPEIQQQIATTQQLQQAQQAQQLPTAVQPAFNIMDYLPAPRMQTPAYQPIQMNQAQLAQTPGYQFALSQGQEAVERSAAAKGGLLSGGTLKDLTAFGQGLASRTYSDEYSRALNEREQQRQAAILQFGSQYQQQVDDYTRQQAARNQQLGLLYNLLGLQAYQPQAPGTQALQDVGAAQAQGYQALGTGLGTAISGVGTAATLYGMQQPVGQPISEPIKGGLATQNMVTRY